MADLNTDPNAIDQFLAAVKQHESGGNYTAYNAGGGASGAYQYIQSTWTSEATSAGYAQYAHGPASAAPPAVQDAVARYNATNLFKGYGSWSNAAEAWYYPAWAGVASEQNSVPYPSAGNTETIGAYGNQILSMMGGEPAGATANRTQADWAALQAAGQQGGTAYLQALAAQGGTAGTSTATQSASVAATPTSTQIGGVSYTGTQQQTSALSTIEANLSTYGFTPTQVKDLTNWAWGEITNNVDPSQIAIDLQAQPAFLQQYPGFAAANQELNTKGLPAVSVQQYQQYQTQAMAMANAAGLPSGFINSNNIGTLIGGNVSTQELSSRINNALVLAYQSTPEQQAAFNEYFGTTYGSNNAYLNSGAPMTAADWAALKTASGQPGGAAYLQANAASAPSGHGPLTPGQIAAIALDPSVAEPLIAQQIAAAQIGGASVTSGVGALSAQTATQLAQAGITSAQATDAFRSLAPYSALETARPGMTGVTEGTVTPTQLATGALLGDPAAQRQLQQAQEVAKAPFAGGGGEVQTAKGVVGAGSASGQGAAS